jgi:hypothetical protein
MRHIIIAGSRKATEEMLNYTRSLVKDLSMKYPDLHILVGDAVGVDLAVANAVKEFDVSCYVYGVALNPRNGIDFKGNYKQGYYRFISKDYGLRDKHIISSSEIGFFIWDGESKGTIAGLRYMKLLAKPCYLITEFNYEGLPNDLPL